MGQAHQKGAAGHGKAQGYHGPGDFRAQGELLRGQGEEGLLPRHIVQQIKAADAVAEHGGPGGPGHVPGKNQYEQGVQGDIGDGAGAVGDHGFPGGAVGSDHIGEHIVEHDKGGAQGDDAQVAHRVCHGVRVRSQQAADGGEKEIDRQQKRHAQGKGRKAAEGGIAFHGLRILFPESQGDGGTASAAEQGSQT